MEKINLLLINSDIYMILKISKKIGWESLKSLTIKRILYLSNVLYTFIYGSDQKNIFGYYNFIYTQYGPDTDLESSFKFLLSNSYIIKDIKTDEYSLGIYEIEGITSQIEFKEHYDWFETIIYILATYGEEKIYDFIFRDPEYHAAFESNLKKELNIEKNNETVKTLNKFRADFEQESNIKNITPLAYLKLYFEYIFTMLIKKEG